MGKRQIPPVPFISGTRACYRTTVNTETASLPSLLLPDPASPPSPSLEWGHDLLDRQDHRVNKDSDLSHGYGIRRDSPELR